LKFEIRYSVEYRIFFSDWWIGGFSSG